MFSQEPPPPRYIMQMSTGKWKKQTVARIAEPKKCLEEFKDSRDYFFRRTMYASAQSASNVDKNVHSPVDVMKQIDEFEKTHRKASSRRVSLYSAVPELNPIIGLFTGVPLCDVCEAILQVKEIHKEKQQDVCSSSATLRLSFDEMYRVCAQLVPNMVSCEYARHMFTCLAREGEEFVSALAFFSFLVEHAFHPVLNRNVDALFTAFDPDNTGVISSATLTPSVISTWAELHLFGNLRGEWEKMAAAVEMAKGVDLRIVNDAKLLTPEATRAVFCASPILYKAMESVDMVGLHIKQLS